MTTQVSFIDKVRHRLSYLRVGRTPRTIRQVRANGFDMLVFCNEDVGRLIWLNGVFEKDETALFSRVVKSGDVCLDIGGNVGYFSLIIGRAASPAPVHVFEPIPLNAALINANLRLNALDNVIVNQLALSDNEGTVRFSVSTDSAYSSMLSTGTSAEAQSIDVTVTTLDAYLEQHGIDKVDIIKMDVEGAEGQVLAGATKLFSDPTRKPRLAMLELYDINLKPYGTSVDMIIETMIGWGYDVKVLSDDGDALVPYEPAMRNIIYNIFFEAQQRR